MKHADIPVPRKMQGLPMTDKGYLKPWFVKADDFRVVDEVKAVESIHKGTCWICGKPNDGPYAFVTGPKSASFNIASEPPCHKECAEYAVKVCPFILLPKAKRRDAGLSPEELQTPANFDPENPGEYFISIVNKYGFRTMYGTLLCYWKNRWVKERKKYVGGQRRKVE